MDPIQPGGPSTTGWNRYAYAGANPTTWADPTGQTVVVETATLSSSSVDRTVRTAAPVGVAVAQLFILAGGAYQAIECVDESFADAQDFGPGICGAILGNDGDEPGPAPITPPSQYESWARDYGVSEDDIRNCEQNGPDSSFCEGLPPELLEILFNNAPSGTGTVRWLDDIRPDRLKHIQDRHLRGGAQWDSNTSYFNNADELESLVTDAADWTPIIQSNGNLATVVDAGRPIGWDAATGAQTNLYTVIIKPGEGVWTAHPGLPRVGG